MTLFICAHCGKHLGDSFATIWNGEVGERFYHYGDCYREAAPLQTAFYEARNRFIAESSAAYPDVDPDEAQRLATEARLLKLDRGSL